MTLTEPVSARRWQRDDNETTAACYEVFRAAHAVDLPDEPVESSSVFGLRLDGWGHNPGEVWYIPGTEVSGGAAAGPVAAFYRIDLPDLENRDRADLDLQVHPALRRRGIGSALLNLAAMRAAAKGNDRTVLDSAVPAGTSGDGFLQSAGATVQLEEIRRIQELRAIAPGRIAELRASAERAAADYTVVRWSGPIPDERYGQVAELYNAMNDAPRGENVEEERWTAERVRTRSGKAVRAGLMRSYSVAAMHKASGEMAGFTEIQVDPTIPEWGWQQLTAVTRPHRGHQLGLLVKTVMLEWLAEAEPQLEKIETGNAASNQHMIAVNETLGYRVAEPRWRFYELPVAAIRSY